VTFDELFSEHNLSEAERESLVWHLAGMRSRATVSSLLKEGGVPRDDSMWHRLTKTLSDIDQRMSAVEDIVAGRTPKLAA
jgi:hypothetical protein